MEPTRTTHIPMRHISQIEFHTQENNLVKMSLLAYDGEVITALNHMEEETNKHTLDMTLDERIYAVKVAVNDDKVVSMEFLLVKDSSNSQ